MFTFLIGWLNEAAAKYGGKQVRCVRSRRDPALDDAPPGGSITDKVRLSLVSDRYGQILMHLKVPKISIITGESPVMEGRSRHQDP